MEDALLANLTTAVPLPPVDEDQAMACAEIRFVSLGYERTRVRWLYDCSPVSWSSVLSLLRGNNLTFRVIESGQ